MNRFKNDDATLNAIVTALAAVVFAVTRRLSPSDHQAFCSDLARMASAREAAGEPIAETVLIDLHRAAQSASSPPMR